MTYVEAIKIFIISMYIHAFTFTISSSYWEKKITEWEKNMSTAQWSTGIIREGEIAEPAGI